MAEDAVLESAEGMFDRRSSEPHQLWRRALVHTVQSIIVHVAAQHPLRGSGAARLHRAGSAVGGPGLIEDGTVFAMQLFALHGFARRTEIAVAAGLVEEVASIEHGSVPLVVDATLARHMRHQPRSFTAARLFAVRVTCVGDDVQGSGTLKRLVCGFSHRFQAAAAGHIERDRMRHDQRMFGIHGGLHVVSRSERTPLCASAAPPVPDAA